MITASSVTCSSSLASSTGSIQRRRAGRWPTAATRRARGRSAQAENARSCSCESAPTAANTARPTNARPTAQGSAKEKAGVGGEGGPRALRLVAGCPRPGAATAARSGTRGPSGCGGSGSSGGGASGPSGIGRLAARGRIGRAPTGCRARRAARARRAGGPRVWPCRRPTRRPNAYRRSSEERMIRETCICEQPTRAAISDCSRSSPKRRPQDLPCAIVEDRRQLLDRHAGLDPLEARVGVAEQVAGAGGVALLLVDRHVERAHGAALGGLQGLQDLLGRAADVLGELRDRGGVPEVPSRGRPAPRSTDRHSSWRSRAGRTSHVESRK